MMAPTPLPPSPRMAVLAMAMGLSLLFSAAASAADPAADARKRTQRALEQPPLRAPLPDGAATDEQRQRTRKALEQSPRPGIPDVALQRDQQFNLNDLLRSAPKVETESNTGPIVFVSLSMPMGSLQRLAADAHKVGGVLVMRGTVNGSLRQTVKAVQRLSEQGVEVQLDPQAFTRYRVVVVPSVLVDLSGPSGCEAARACADRSVLVEGDVSLAHSLDHIARFSLSPKLKSQATQWVALLNGGVR